MNQNLDALRKAFADTEGVVRCIVCQRAESEVQVIIIMGPAAICNNCVDKASEALAEYKVKAFQQRNRELFPNQEDLSDISDAVLVETKNDKL